MEMLLNKGELLNLGKNLQGLAIIFQSGTCWLTQAGDSRDHILRAGQKFEIRSKGQIVLCAADPCRLQMVELESTVSYPLVQAAGTLQ